MSAIEPLCHLMGINSAGFSKNERSLLEAELFVHVYEELKETFRKQLKNYFILMKFNKKMENEMLETNFIRLIIKDILASEDYTLAGIANYTDTPEEIMQEIVIERTNSLSANLLRKLIELHKTVRPELYKEIIQKITLQFGSAPS